MMMITPDQPQRNKRRVRRILLYTSAAALLFGLVAWLGLNWYLRSSYVRTFAASQLNELTGLTFEIEELDVGNSETQIKFRIIEPAPQENDTPVEVLRVESVRADISLADLITGSVQPKEVSVDGLALSLAFDANGQLQTKMPKFASDQKANLETTGSPWPKITVKDAQIQMQQLGQLPFQVRQIQILGESSGDVYTIRGEANDPIWGQWLLAGEIHQQKQTGWIELQSAETPVDVELLRTIPLIPALAWDHVQTAGRAKIIVRLDFLESGEFGFLITIQPNQSTQMTLQDLDATVTNLTGEVRINAQGLEIDQCRSNLAGGTMLVDGKLQWDTQPTKLELEVEASGLDVQKLPASWSLPKNVTGDLKIEPSQLQILIDDQGQLTTSGGGKASIENAKLNNLPVEVRFQLRSDGRGYRFQAMDDEQSLRKRLIPNLLPTLIVLGQPPKAIEPAPETPTILETSIKLRDIDIAEIIKQFEIEIPVRLLGQVTVSVQAKVPLGDVAEADSYEFDGRLTAPRIQVEDLIFENVKITLKYKKGILYLQEFNSDIPSDGKEPGIVRGQASAEISPQGAIKANLKITRFPAAELVKAIPGLTMKASGTLDVQTEFESSIEQISDPKAWKGTAKFTGKDLQLDRSAIGQFALNAKLQDGVMQVSLSEAQLFNGTVEGQGVVPLLPTQKGELELKFTDFDIASASRLIPGMPVKITGKVSGALKAKASEMRPDQGRDISGNLDLTAPKLTLQGIPAEKLTGDLKILNERLEYTLNGKTLGGTFEVKGSYPPAKSNKPDQPKSELPHIYFQKIELKELAEVFQVSELQSLQGQVDAIMDFASDLKTGNGQLVFKNLSYGRQNLATQLQGKITLNEQSVELSEFRGQFIDGTLSVRVKYDLNNPLRSYYILKLDRANLAKISPLLSDDRKFLSGDASLQVVGRLGGRGGSATLNLGQVTLADMKLSQIRVPMTWTGDPMAGLFRVRQAEARLGLGKIGMNAEFGTGVYRRFSSKVTLDRVPLKPFIGSSARAIGNGTLSGQAQFSADHLRTLADLKGTMIGKINKASVRELPLLNVAGPFLSPFGLVKPLDQGDIQASLAKNVIRLDRVSLTGPSANIFADGTITTAGRIDLEIVASTGDVSPNFRGFQLLGLDITALAPLPIAVILKVSDLVSNRIIRLNISGTTSRPQVKINRAALLTENAARFFLGRYAIPPELQNR